MAQAYLPNDYPNSIFSTFSFLGFLVCMVPLPWHLEAWNAGMCMFMIWTGLGCLLLFVNSLVWHHNAINWSPVWCDIAVRYIVGLNIATPATCLCITRRLYHITAIRIPASKLDNRRAILVDVAIGMGMPILGMVLQYIPQGHRFNIFEDVGCWPYTYNTIVGLALVSVPPAVICLVSGVYAVLSLRSFWKSRGQFDEVLSSMGHRNLTPSRYVRLLCFSSLGVVITFMGAMFSLGMNVHFHLVKPWTGWMDTHEDFQRVDQYPAIIWRSRSDLVVALEGSRWCIVGSAFLFLVFFGFVDGAVKKYRSALQTVSTNIGLSSSTSTELLTTSSGAGVKVPPFPAVEVAVPEHVLDISPIRSQSQSSIAMTNSHLSIPSSPTRISNVFPAIAMTPLGRTNTYQIV
ncbi:STE3-domain-containing protein [Pluteus cervinus]|uniref:STE3-domain-containing protein n=1 Tax=Pluteus cervinus TaxID=181527 RepID=A0ACD3AN95_9AGAR|nr:STE3-domain-containing protein [Pluteus cervinus]